MVLFFLSLGFRGYLESSYWNLSIPSMISCSLSSAGPTDDSSAADYLAFAFLLGGLPFLSGTLERGLSAIWTFMPLAWRSMLLVKVFSCSRLAPWFICWMWSYSPCRRKSASIDAPVSFITSGTSAGLVTLLIGETGFIRSALGFALIGLEI